MYDDPAYNSWETWLLPDTTIDLVADVRTLIKKWVHAARSMTRRHQMAVADTALSEHTSLSDALPL